MKVQMNTESKQVLSIAEMPKAKEIIASFAADKDVTAATEIAYAIKDCVKVYEATATITKNQRIYNAFDDESGSLDIWLQATVQTAAGFMIIGAYLSDIWQLDGNNSAEIESHMYIRKFVEA